VLVVQPSVDGDLEPVVAIAGRQSFVEVRRACGVLLGIGQPLGYVADVVVVADAGVGAYVPVGGGIDGGVELESAVDVPVAVDVLWSRDASARRRVARSWGRFF
jgi:hypothetical protein